MRKPLKVFIGYDSRETVAYHVLANSIIRQSSIPVEIIPLALNHLKGIFTRENVGTTEFSLTRFLVPYLSGYEGYSIFMDCDMLSFIDFKEIDNLIQKNLGRDAVLVCPHDYTPKEGAKATGVQTSYPKKNWSSFMIFNNEMCGNLTPEYVNQASAMDLHRFNWIPAGFVGHIPLEYNWLVGEYDYKADIKIAHYTLGTPCFEAYLDCDYSSKWHTERGMMNGYKEFSV